MAVVRSDPNAAKALGAIIEAAHRIVPEVARIVSGFSPVTAAAGEAAAQKLEGRPVDPNEVAQAAMLAAIPIGGIVRAGRPSRHAIRRLAELGRRVTHLGPDPTTAARAFSEAPGKSLAEKALHHVLPVEGTQALAQLPSARIRSQAFKVFSTHQNQLGIAKEVVPRETLAMEKLPFLPVFRGEMPVYRADLMGRGGLPGRGTYHTATYGTAEDYAFSQAHSARAFGESLRDRVTRRRLERRAATPARQNIYRGIMQFNRAFVAPPQFGEPIDLYVAAARALRAPKPNTRDLLAAQTLNTLYGHHYNPERILRLATRSKQGQFRIADKEFARALSRGNFDGAVFPGSEYVISIPPPKTPLPKGSPNAPAANKP